MTTSLSKIFIALYILLAITVAGCANQKRATPPGVAPQYHAHTVTYSGETLALISKWYTGDSENWKRIAAANPKVNPARMQIGTVLQIPLELVKRTEPLPQKAIPRVSHPRQPSTRATATSEAPSPNEMPSEPTDSNTMIETPPSEEAAETTNEPAAPSDIPSVVGADEAAAVPADSMDSVEPSAPSIETPSVPAVQPSDARVRTRDELLDELLQ